MSGLAIPEVAELSVAKRELLKRTIADNTTDDEFALFMATARHLGLDPFRRQIYIVVRNTRDGDGRKATIEPTLAGYRAIASRTGAWQGQLGPHWCGEDGQWRDVWLEGSKPRAARVGVLRRGFTEPVWGVATLDEFSIDGPVWRKFPARMLANAAEREALKRAFPEALPDAAGDEQALVEDVVRHETDDGRALDVDPSTGEVLEGEVVEAGEGSDELPSDEGPGAAVDRPRDGDGSSEQSGEGAGVGQHAATGSAADIGEPVRPSAPPDPPPDPPGMDDPANEQQWRAALRLFGSKPAILRGYADLFGLNDAHITEGEITKGQMADLIRHKQGMAVGGR